MVLGNIFSSSIFIKDHIIEHGLTSRIMNGFDEALRNQDRSLLIEVIIDSHKGRSHTASLVQWVNVVTCSWNNFIHMDFSIAWRSTSQLSTKNFKRSISFRRPWKHYSTHSPYVNPTMINVDWMCSFRGSCSNMWTVMWKNYHKLLNKWLIICYNES